MASITHLANAWSNDGLILNYYYRGKRIASAWCLSVCPIVGQPRSTSTAALAAACRFSMRPAYVLSEKCDLDILVDVVGVVICFKCFTVLWYTVIFFSSFCIACRCYLYSLRQEVAKVCISIYFIRFLCPDLCHKLYDRIYTSFSA